MKKFEQLKDELLQKAKEKQACSDQYRRAYKSKTEEELLKVIHDNIGWCSENKVISNEWLSGFSAKALLESGVANTGLENTGFANSGNWNSGYRNSGYMNSGDWNSGYMNNGYRNSGNWNSGDWNSGDWNSTRHSSGVFNSRESTIMMFNKPSDWTYSDWVNSYAYDILSDFKLTEWISWDDMTDDEKKQYPKAYTCGGYLKTYGYKEAFKTMWDNLTEKEKNAVRDLPNFDADVFEEITGVKL